MIENWDKKPKYINPLFPYKGQKFTIFKGKDNGGTSDTWYKYQKLYNKVFNSNSKEIVFHNSFFITELNANTSSYSKNQNPENRKISINDRIGNFFISDFIQSFPIIILASSHYTRDHDIDICKLFNVEFQKPTIQIESNPKQWYNLHTNKEGEKAKLVIHTRQLSMDIKDKLLEEIANEIKSFANKNKIEI